MFYVSRRSYEWDVARMKVGRERHKPDDHSFYEILPIDSEVTDLDIIRDASIRMTDVGMWRNEFSTGPGDLSWKVLDDVVATHDYMGMLLRVMRSENSRYMVENLDRYILNL